VSVSALHTGVSFLFVPGDRSDRFGKAVATAADLVVIDLEDAVDPADKWRARAAAAAWLAGRGRACVRVNAHGSAEFDRDLQALAGLPGLAAVVVPKADLASTRSVAKRCPAPMIALIESAAGIAEAAAVAARPGVARLAFGHLDYAFDIGAQPSRTAMLHARSTLVHASRLAGLPGPIDGVTTALDDVEALGDDLRHAQEIGMTGKLLIHPRQVAPTNVAFGPDESTVRWAQRVLDAAATGAAVRVDGHMVDAPVIARARAVLAQLH
jgi:citrate lyase subunit beta / citryl-CoA lyase